MVVKQKREVLETNVVWDGARLTESLEELHRSLDAERPGTCASKETCEELEALCSKIEEFLGYHCW